MTGDDDTAPAAVGLALPVMSIPPALSGASRLQMLSDAIPHMLWSSLPDGTHDYYNAQWHAFTGLAGRAGGADAWAAAIHPDDREHAVRQWHDSLASGAPLESEYRLRRHDGVYRWVLARARPVRADDDSAIERWVGTFTEIDDARRAADLNRLLSRELGHRIKNLFAVISGLIQQSTRSQPALRPVVDDLQARIAALSRAHDYVRPRDDDTAPRSLKAMLVELLSPYPAHAVGRIAIDGGDMVIAADAATPLALAVHELATNAVKYGALAHDEGHLRIEVAVGPAATTVSWRETLPTATAAIPATTGFGSSLIDLAVCRQLGGTITRTWLATGLDATMVLPNARLHH